MFGFLAFDFCHDYFNTIKELSKGDNYAICEGIWELTDFFIFCNM